jgi:hypothetical protein
MKKRKVVEACLTYRFNAVDGWNRETVSELFTVPVEYVVPRYHDFNLDKLILSLRDSDHKLNLPAGLVGTPRVSLDYFAVYNEDYFRMVVSSLRDPDFLERYKVEVVPFQVFGSKEVRDGA